MKSAFERGRYTGEDLTIVVCAYGVCEQLERSLRAIKHQTIKTRILISTSTPNEHIYGLAEKYGIEVRINPEPGHVKDYNYALSQVETRLGMIAHQDDILQRQFAECSIKALNKASTPIISFTDYAETHENNKVDRRPSGLITIKRIIVWPMRVPFFRSTVLAKRMGQMIGNPITHPSVICVMDQMPNPIFREEYKATMDWDLWERLSRKKGEFVYVNKVLLLHRMSKENATAKLLETTNIRSAEEKEILSRFWPDFITRWLSVLYSKSAMYY